MTNLHLRANFPAPSLFKCKSSLMSQIKRNAANANKQTQNEKVLNTLIYAI